MGVRFPLQQQRPDFGQIQQPNDARQAQQNQPQPANPDEARGVRETAENEAALQAREPQALAARGTAVERAAGDAGAQTPGSIIDMLA